MVSFEEIAAMLDDVADELPEAFYKDLNGGIYLLPEQKLHPESKSAHLLYIMGEYHSERAFGKYITIYYGSFVQVYSHLTPEEQKSKLKQILIHEFTHHLEFMAGEKGLEIKDAQDLAKYRQGTY